MTILDYVLWCIIMVLPIVLLAIANGNWLKTDRRFVIKKAIDCMVPVVSYGVLVFLHYYCLKGELSREQVVRSLLPQTLIIVVVFVSHFINQVRKFSKTESKDLIGTWYVVALIGLFVILLSAAAMANYALYILWDGFYSIPDGLNHAEVGFEFLYYTFTLMLTYGTNSIEAIHIGSKLVQILEISAFYVLIGIVFSDLVEKAKHSVRKD